MKAQKERRISIRTMATIAVFCAMAYVCQYVFRIHVMFLSFDAKDAIMAIGAMLFGPAWGLVMAFFLAFLEFLTVSDTGIIGFVMNFVSSAAFIGVSSWIYRYKRTMNGAVIGLLSGVLATTTVMLLCNLFLTPIYTGQSVEVIVKLIPTLLLPFNLTKAIFNAGLVLVLYKPISMALKKAKVLKGSIGTFRFDRKTVFVLVVGLLLIAFCVVVFLVLLGGEINVDILDKVAQV